MKKLALAVLFGLGVSGAIARGQELPALGATNGLTSQRYLGTGKGVTIAVLDSGIDVNHPTLKGSVSSQKDFTGEKILDDATKGWGHATGISGILLGRPTGDFEGLAPAAKLINARVDNSDDFTTDAWAGKGLLWSAQKGAKVANISFGNKLASGGQLTERFSLMCDYVAEKYGVNICVAGGNDGNTDGSSVRQVPADLFNGYTVGAVNSDFTRAAAFSNYAQEDDKRSKPDLMAPGERVLAPIANWERRGSDYAELSGTSFAAPMVGGVLAQMIGYGKSHDLPTDPLLLKAILMTTASKSRDTDGTPWEPRSGKRDKYFGRVISKPLDDEQGAGSLDAVAAYRLYSKTKARSTPVNTWKEGTLKGDKALDVKLGKLAAGQRVDATLTWYRHVTYKDRGKEGFDDKDTVESESLADFTLRLLKDGHPVVASDSSVDNLEHLSWTLEGTGNYVLQVYRFNEGGLASEKFALAARVLKDLAALAELTPQVAGVSRAVAEPFSMVGAIEAPVPEPGATGVLSLVTTWLLRRRPLRNAE